MITDKLKLNESKTEFMIIGTRQHLSKINRNSLLVDSDRVESVTEARNLGVLFDCNFNFCNLITKTSGLAFYSLHDIRRIRQYLTQDATKTLVQALVISRLDYSNSLLYGLPNIHINKLQRVEPTISGKSSWDASVRRGLKTSQTSETKHNCQNSIENFKIKLPPPPNQC